MPSRLLLLNDRKFKLVKSNKLSGISPINWLFPISILTNSCNTPISEGISPDNWFPFNNRELKLLKLVNSIGKTPDNSLFLRSNCCKLTRFPMFSGRPPLTLEDASHRMINSFNVISWHTASGITRIQWAVMNRSQLDEICRCRTLSSSYFARIASHIFWGPVWKRFQGLKTKTKTICHRFRFHSRFHRFRFQKRFRL